MAALPDTEVEKQSTGESNSNNEPKMGVKREEKFSVLSMCGIALSTGESWIALGNSLVCGYCASQTRKAS